MKDFITVDNVPFNWTERLHELESYTLYVSDCFWMLKTENYCEFYYNPCMFCLPGRLPLESPVQLSAYHQA